MRTQRPNLHQILDFGDFRGLTAAYDLIPDIEMPRDKVFLASISETKVYLVSSHGTKEAMGDGDHLSPTYMFLASYNNWIFLRQVQVGTHQLMDRR